MYARLLSSVAFNDISQDNLLERLIVFWEIAAEELALKHDEFLSDRKTGLLKLEPHHRRYSRMASEDELDIFLDYDKRKRSDSITNGNNVGSIEIHGIARRQRHACRKEYAAIE